VIRDFSGGFNDTVNPINLKDNEYCELKNLDNLYGGGVSVRNGTKKINTNAFPANIEQIIEWPLKTGVTKTIVVSNYKIYEFNSASGEYFLCTLQNGNALTLQSNTISYSFFKDYFYFTDGFQFYKWSDEYFYRTKNNQTIPLNSKVKVNISLDDYKRSSLPNGVTNKTGAMINDFVGTEDITTQNVRDGFGLPMGTVSLGLIVDNINYLYSLHCTDSYSLNYSYLGIPFRFDSFTKENKIIKTPYAGNINYKLRNGIYINVYNNVIQHNANKIAEVGKTYKFKWDGSNQTTTLNLHTNLLNTNQFELLADNYTDITAISIYGVTAGTGTLNDNIRKCKYFVYHPQSFRFFASGNPDDPTAVYYSEVNSMELWLNTSVFYPRFNLGLVNDLIIVGDSVIACYYKGFTSISGTSITDFIYKNISVPFGIDNSNTLELVPSGIIFYTNEKLYLLSSTLFDSNYVKIPGNQEYSEISKNRVENILKGSSGHYGVYHNDKYYLSFQKNNENFMLVYDFYKNHFLIYSGIAFKCLLSKQSNKLIGASGVNILELYSNDLIGDYVDGETVATTFHLKSKIFDFSEEYKKSILSKFFITFFTSNKDTSIFNDIKIVFYGDGEIKEEIYELKEDINNSLSYTISQFFTNYSFNKFQFEIISNNLNLLEKIIFYDFGMDLNVTSENANNYSNNKKRNDFLPVEY
jgi:hypothetical protein